MPVLFMCSSQKIIASLEKLFKLLVIDSVLYKHAHNVS